MTLAVLACGAEPEDTRFGAGAPDSQVVPGDEPRVDSPNAGRPIATFEEDFDDLSVGALTDSYVDAQRVFSLERWTQLQLDGPSDNVVEIVETSEGRAMGCVVRGNTEGQASKAALGKQNLPLHEGALVDVRFDLFVDAATSPSFVTSTFFDLEDADELRVEGEIAGAGVRLRVNDAGFFQVDRGELVGSDAGEPAHFRLANFTSDKRAPTGQWFTIRARMKLGTDVESSRIEPIDDSFDTATTASWIELYYSDSATPEELILRMKGTLFLDRQAGLAAASEAGVTLQWPPELTMESFQFGCTNNRSTEDQRLLVDNIEIAQP